MVVDRVMAKAVDNYLPLSSELRMETLNKCNSPRTETTNRLRTFSNSQTSSRLLPFLLPCPGSSFALVVSFSLSFRGNNMAIDSYLNKY